MYSTTEFFSLPPILLRDRKMLTMSTFLGLFWVAFSTRTIKIIKKVLIFCLVTHVKARNYLNSKSLFFQNIPTSLPIIIPKPKNNPLLRYLNVIRSTALNPINESHPKIILLSWICCRTLQHNEYI